MTNNLSAVRSSLAGTTGIGAAADQGPSAAARRLADEAYELFGLNIRAAFRSGNPTCNVSLRRDERQYSLADAQQAVELLRPRLERDGYRIIDLTASRHPEYAPYTNAVIEGYNIFVSGMIGKPLTTPMR